MVVACASLTALALAMATDGRCSAASDGNRDRCTIRCADADAYLPLGRCRPLGSSVLRARLRIQPQDSQLGFCAVGVRRAGGAIERFNQKTLPPPGKLTLLPPGKLSRLLRPYETAPRAAALWAARSFFFFFFEAPRVAMRSRCAPTPSAKPKGKCKSRRVWFRGGLVCFDKRASGRDHGAV